MHAYFATLHSALFELRSRHGIINSPIKTSLRLKIRKYLLFFSFGFVPTGFAVSEITIERRNIGWVK
jgi:hypothetical protein